MHLGYDTIRSDYEGFLVDADDTTVARNNVATVTYHAHTHGHR